MRVFDLINLLGQEDPEAQVLIVDSRDQSKWRDFTFNSQETGVSQIPFNRVLLMAKPGKAADNG